MTRTKPTVPFPIQSGSLLHRLLVLLARRVSDRMLNDEHPDTNTGHPIRPTKYDREKKCKAKRIIE